MTRPLAVTLTLVFFFLNDKWLETPPEELYKMARAVAESKPENREKVLDLLVKYFNGALVDRSSAIKRVRAKQK